MSLDITDKEVQKHIKSIGYKGCQNCQHQIKPLRMCEWAEQGGDGHIHLFCPKWDKRNDNESSMDTKNHVIIISYNMSESVEDGIYQTGLREFFYHDYNDIFKAVIKESSEHDHVCIIDYDNYVQLPNHHFTTIRDNSLNVWKGSNV